MSARAEATGAGDELPEAIASGALDRVRRAIRARAERLRLAHDDREAASLAGVLGPLAVHPSARVRQAVAEAADVLPTEAFDALLTRFDADTDGFVRTAITRAAKRRAQRRKTRARAGAEEQVLAALLAEMEARHGKGARRLAERAVRRGTEYFVRTLHHEAVKIVTPLEHSLNRLRSEVTRPTLDRGALAHDVGAAWERFRHLWSVLDGAKDVTATIVPRFLDEPLLPLVEEASSQLALRLGPRAARLSLVTEVPPALRLDAHRSGLLQALQNFFQNAAEAYLPDAPSLTLRVSARMLRAESQVEITITDHGVGMNEEQLESLFVPFGSHKEGGTGLGLLVARAMIEDVHGGTLAFESRPGAGTTVTIVVPARQAGRRAR